MSRIGLLGGAYTSQSVAVDSQSCVNLIVERDESQAGKSEGTPVLRPGMKLFSAPAVPALPEIAIAGPCGVLTTLPDGTLLTAQNTSRPNVPATFIHLYSVAADGTRISAGTLSFNGNSSIGSAPMSIAVSLVWAVIIDPVPGEVWYAPVPFVAGGFSSLTPANWTTGGNVLGMAHVVYLDGYFIALKANSNQIYYTLDPTLWDPTHVFTPSVSASNVRAIISDHRELWVIGDLDTVVYYDSGDLLNPFQPNPSGLIEQGIAAAATLVQLDNTLFWIGKDNKGQGIAWRANGYTPQRISTFAIESAWASYATIADAVAYPAQMQGHSFWVIFFPTANKTWVYDVASGLWSEWNHWKNDGTFEAHRSWVHAFAFGKHLVGDWKTGNIYEMEMAKSNGTGGWLFCDDFGDPIQWQRRLPYVAQENERLFHQVLEVDLETGLGPIPPLASAGDLGALTLTQGPN